MLSPGDRVKDCEVIAPLGSGGMATLYLARRRGVGGFSRLVTLKLVHPHLIQDESVIQLFLDEARISAHIAHPNVVHVEEVGEYDGSYFIAMEYVHGVSLAELLARLSERRVRLRRKLCVWLAAQIAEALHAAHEAKGESGAPLGIVHRDVSPQNVLIGHNGHVKLIDFGIAKSQAEADHRTYGRPVLGKLRYMSPEQLRLERADRRVDVYALGVVLWEMLTGRNLLRCQRFDDERDWRTRENPSPPSRYAGHSPPALDLVVLKAIAYEPSERYESALQLRSALLRADPEAARIDAPMVAALMHSMLGDELARRRAHWPTAIVAELAATPGVTISRSWSIDELTDTVAAPAGEHVADGGAVEAAHEADDEPTFARESPIDDAATSVLLHGSRLSRAPQAGGTAHAVLARARGTGERAHPAVRRALQRPARRPVRLSTWLFVALWHTLLRSLVGRPRGHLATAPRRPRSSVTRGGGRRRELHEKLARLMAAVRRIVVATGAVTQRAVARPRAVLRASGDCVTRSACCAVVSACMAASPGRARARATSCVASAHRARCVRPWTLFARAGSVLSSPAAALGLVCRCMGVDLRAVWRGVRAQRPALWRARRISLAILVCFGLSFFVSTFLLRGTPCEPAAQAQRPPPKAAPRVEPKLVPAPFPLRSLQPSAATIIALHVPDAAPERESSQRASADDPPVPQRELPGSGDADSGFARRGSVTSPAAQSRRSIRVRPSPYGSYRSSERLTHQTGRVSAAISSKGAWRRRWVEPVRQVSTR